MLVGMLFTTVKLGKPLVSGGMDDEIVVYIYAKKCYSAINMTQTLTFSTT